jgi:ribosome-associated protein
MTSPELADRIARLAYDKKGHNIVILDLREITDIADFFIIVSGESDIHIKTLANYIEQELFKEKIRPWHKEGLSSLNWVLLDYVEVVAHIFKPEVREHYALERLWADAKFMKVDDHAEVRVVPG